MQRNIKRLISWKWEFSVDKHEGGKVFDFYRSFVIEDCATRFKKKEFADNSQWNIKRRKLIWKEARSERWNVIPLAMKAFQRRLNWWQFHSVVTGLRENYFRRFNPAKESTRIFIYKHFLKCAAREKPSALNDHKLFRVNKLLHDLLAPHRRSERDSCVMINKNRRYLFVF